MKPSSAKNNKDSLQSSGFLIKIQNLRNKKKTNASVQVNQSGSREIDSESIKPRWPFPRNDHFNEISNENQ